MIDARCSCGTVRLSLPGPSNLVVACHCVDCQRRSGAPFGVGAFYPVEVVTISGAPKEYVRPAACGRQGALPFLHRLRPNRLLEGGQSARADRSRRRHDCGPELPGPDQIGFRAVETCVGRDRRRRASSRRERAKVVELRAARQKLVPAEGIGQFSRQETPRIVSFGVWLEEERPAGPVRPRASP
jgi:hypothetical protein